MGDGTAGHGTAAGSTAAYHGCNYVPEGCFHRENFYYPDRPPRSGPEVRIFGRHFQGEIPDRRSGSSFLNGAAGFNSKYLLNKN